MATNLLTENIKISSLVYRDGINQLGVNMQETLASISTLDIKKEISQVKEEVDEKYTILKKKVNRAIVVSSRHDYIKTIEKVIEEKYSTLRNEVNNNIAEKLIREDISQVKQELEEMKKAVRSKGLPREHCSLCKHGDYLNTFSVHRHNTLLL